MARIAEDLLLTLLDNTAGRPQLERSRLGRALAAALILDLALGCRVRPALPGEPMPPGTLVALTGPVPMDPAVRPALAILEQGPLTPSAAIAKLRKSAEDDVLDQLLRTGQIHQIQLSKPRLLRRNTYSWPLHDRARVEGVRATMAAVLFGNQRPDIVTAALIALLGAVDGFGAALNLDADGARHAGSRAAGVTFGAWADGANPAAADLAGTNLAVTAAAVLPALT